LSITAVFFQGISSDGERPCGETNPGNKVKEGVREAFSSVLLPYEAVWQYEKTNSLQKGRGGRVEKI
jgi:hypothetical protein